MLRRRTLRAPLLSTCILALAAAGGCGEATTTDAGPDVRTPDGGMTDTGPRDGGIDAPSMTDVPAMTDAPADAPMADDAPPTIDAPPDAPASGGFSVASFDSTGCMVVDVEDLLGDDHGGIGVGADGVILLGDDGTGGYGLDLTGGALLPAPPGALVIDGADNLVSDLASGQLYLLGNAAGPLGTDGGDRMLTRLVPADALAAPGAGGPTLSTPIDLSAGGIGIFAGSGEVGIHDGTDLHVINLATGAVTNLGPVTISHSGCETWAYWGVLERVAGVYSVVAVQDSTTIARTTMPAGTTTALGTFTELSDMCGFAASPTNNRWYFHHEGSSQFSATTSEALGYCDAVYAVAAGDFSITSLGTTGCNVIEVESVIGDDRSGMAVAPPGVFLVGDDALARWNLDLTSRVRGVSGDFIYDGIFSDVDAETIWTLGDDSGPTGENPRVTSIIPLGIDGTLGTPVTLSAAIDLTAPAEDVGIFSGSGEVLIHDGTTLFRVALPTGVVTSLGAMTMPDHSTCETWAYWGIAENVGGARSVLVVNGSNIDRVAVPSGTVTTVSTFANLSDMCTIAVSPTTGRWYFHHEGDSELGPSNEALGYCDVTIAP